MSQFRMFFRWVGRAILERNGAAPDPAVVAAAVIRQEGHDSQEDYRRTALAALAGASDVEVRATTDAVVRELTADRPEAAHRLTDYLLRLPTTVRRNLARPADPAGVSLPDGLPLRAPDDLRPFLPTLDADGRPAPLSDADRAAALELAIRAALEVGRRTGLRRQVIELLRLEPGREDLSKLLARLPEESEQPERVVNSLGLELVLVPDGRFVMGSDEREPERSRDEPQHRLRIRRPFYLAVMPVTQEQYERVAGVNPSYFTPNRGGGPRHPVECVAWEPATAFCQRLSARADEMQAGHVYRLPTEAEWEYACRAGTETPFAFGVSLSSVQANFNGHYPSGGAPRGPYREATMPVGSFMPNHWGLYDLHGNVAEWCADWYGEGYYRHAPRRDPLGPASGSMKVVRGGGWASPAAQCRSAARSVSVPTQRHPGIGFRVVLEVKS